MVFIYGASGKLLHVGRSATLAYIIARPLSARRMIYVRSAVRTWVFYRGEVLE